MNHVHSTETHPVNSGALQNQVHRTFMTPISSKRQIDRESIFASQLKIVSYIDKWCDTMTWRWLGAVPIIIRVQYSNPSLLHRSKTTFTAEWVFTMPDAPVHAKRSPHSRPRTAPSTLSYWGPPIYPTMLDPPGAMSAASGSSLGYISPIRTISPQISNLHSPSRGSLKADEIGHRVARQGTTPPGPWSHKSCSMPQKLPYELRHHVRRKTSDQWVPEPRFVCGERAKILKPSPLRIICESDVDSECEWLPNSMSPSLATRSRWRLIICYK